MDTVLVVKIINNTFFHCIVLLAYLLTLATPPSVTGRHSQHERHLWWLIVVPKHLNKRSKTTQQPL